MDRTNSLLAKASQYLRSGGVSRPTSSVRVSKNEEFSKGDNEVEAYLRSLGNDGKEGKSVKNTLPSTGLSSQTFTGRGRSFLKAKTPLATANISEAAASKDLVQEKKRLEYSRNSSVSSVSSPSPPHSPKRRTVRANLKQQRSEDVEEVDEDDGVLDQRLVEEHLRAALKTTGGTRNTFENDIHAPPIGKLRDLGDNTQYTMTFEEDINDEQNTAHDNDAESIEEVDEDVDADYSPLKNITGIEDFEDFANVPVIQVEHSRKSYDHSSSVASVASESRPVSVASSLSVKSEIGQYSDDFEDSSIHSAKPAKEEPPFLQIKPPAYTGTSLEPQSIASASRGLDESVAQLTESGVSNSSLGRKRSQSAGHSILKLNAKPKDNRKEEPRLPPQQNGGPYTSNSYTQNPMFYNQMPMNFPGNVAPVVLMVPPQSFFANFHYMSQQMTEEKEEIRIKGKPNDVNTEKIENAPELRENAIKMPTDKPPSIFVPLFLERSNTKQLISQCRMLSMSIEATRQAHQLRISKLALK